MNRRMATGVAIVASAFTIGNGEAVGQTVDHDPLPQVPAPEASIDIERPFGLLANVGGLALLAGAAAARTRRGLVIRNEYRQADEHAEQAGLHLSAASAALNSRLKVLDIDRTPEDDTDIPSLQILGNAVEQVRSGLKDAQKASKMEYSIEAGKVVWPDKESVIKLADDLEKKATPVQNLRNKVFIVGVHAAELENFGWDLTAFDVRLPSFDTLEAQLKDEKGADRSALLDTTMQAFEELDLALGELPIRRDAANAKTDQLPGVIETQESVVTEAKTQLATLQAEYDSTCYKDLNDLAPDMDGQLENLRTLQQRAAKLRGANSVAALEEAEGLISEFESTKQTILSATEKIKERQADLERIKTELPGVIEGLDSEVTKVHSFAFEEHTADVEDDTRSAIESFQQELEEFKATEVAAEKPSYLRIDEATEEYKNRLTELRERAEAEEGEMRSLRVSAKLSAFHVETNQSITKQFIEEFRPELGRFARAKLVYMEIPEVRTDLDRDALRDQAANLESLEASTRRLLDQVADARRRAIRSREREASWQRLQSASRILGKPITDDVYRRWSRDYPL